MTPRTLRDDFAMAALTGLVAAHKYPPTDDYAAEKAYLLADAMLRAREVGVRDTDPAPKPKLKPAAHEWALNMGQTFCVYCGISNELSPNEPAKECFPR